MMQQKRRMLWAVDPFCDDDCALTRKIARAVGAFAAQWRAEVEPVYALAEPIHDTRATSALLPVLVPEIQSEAEERLERLLLGIEIQHLKPLRLLQHPVLSLREAADQVIAYAKESEAHLIATGTRTRKGLERMLLGSFAETLLFRSDVPLYVINPHQSVSRQLKRIFFPTHFSDASRWL